MPLLLSLAQQHHLNALFILLLLFTGDGIKDAGLSAWGALTIMYLFNMVVTEILTNNAAAAICVPLGLAIADSLEVSAKPFIMAVLIASSASFMTPIGYQTNTVRFIDHIHIVLLMYC
jgi:di/tricarboxylate transporter